MNACRSCKAPIRWALTENGKRMPLDADPVDDGTFEIVGEQRVGEQLLPLVRVLLHGEGDLTLLDAPPRYRSHFATCPFADQHRRR